MSTPSRHIYEMLPDEQHKRGLMPKKCQVTGCDNDALLYGRCWYCHEEIAALDEWNRGAKGRAEARAKFFADLLACLKVVAGVALYLGCVGGVIWLVGRVR